MASLTQLEATDISGKKISFNAYEGKTLLVVNTASACGFTPQYKGLEALYQKYKDQGFVVLGFPCNQFGEQEPAGDAEIQTFCERNFGVTFPLFSKVDVNGEEAHPIFQYLTGPDGGAPGAVKWNFEKFLVDRTGKLARRFSSRIAPDGKQLAEAIEGVL